MTARWQTGSVPAWLQDGKRGKMLGWLLDCSGHVHGISQRICCWYCFFFFLVQRWSCAVDRTLNPVILSNSSSSSWNGLLGTSILWLLSLLLEITLCSWTTLKSSYSSYFLFRSPQYNVGGWLTVRKICQLCGFFSLFLLKLVVEGMSFSIGFLCVLLVKRTRRKR